jgi:hypothetical protein
VSSERRLRAGAQPAAIKAVASPDLMKQVSRHADCAKSPKEFLNAVISGG